MINYESKSREELINELQELYKENNSLKTLYDKTKAEFSLSELRFKNLYDSLGDAVYVAKIGGQDKGQILEVNLEATKQTGYSREELLKMNIIEDLTILNTGEISTTEWDKKLHEGEMVSNIEKKSRKNGSEFWTEVTVTPFEYKGVKASLSINHDITERKESNEKLIESEARFRRAILLAPNPIMIHNEDNLVLQLSAGWTKYSGYTIEDIPTMGAWNEKAYGEKSEFATEYIDQLFELKETMNNGEWNVKSKSGEIRVWEFFTTPLGVFKDGKRVLLSVAIDHTEHKKSEQISLDQMDELNRFNQLMIGRENKMQELKQEINKLCEEHDLPNRYLSAEKIEKLANQ